MKKLIFLFLILMGNNIIFSMEAERKSLASFFGIESIPKDLYQQIAHRCAIKHQWWYVDKDLEHDEGKVLSAAFNSKGTEIVTLLNGYATDVRHDPSTICIWDNNKNKIIERKTGALYSASVIFDPIKTQVIEKGFGDDLMIHHRPFIDAIKNGSIDLKYSFLSFNKIATEALTIYSQKIYRENIRDKTIILVPTKKEQFISAQFNAHENEIVTLTRDGKLSVWDKDSGAKLLKYEHEFDVKEAYFNHKADQLLVYGENHPIVYIHDRKNGEIVMQLEHPRKLIFVRYNPVRNEICTFANDGIIRIWDCNTGKGVTQMYSVAQKYIGKSSCLEWNMQGTKIIGAVGSCARVWARYDDYTLSQILLNELFHIWLQLEKPSKEINVATKLLNVLAHISSCDRVELEDIWLSFPKNMQEVLWRSMYKKIQRYGK